MLLWTDGVRVCVVRLLQHPCILFAPTDGGSLIEKTNCTSLSFQLPPDFLIPMRCLFKALMPDKEHYMTRLDFLWLCFLWPEAYCAPPAKLHGISSSDHTGHSMFHSTTTRTSKPYLLTKKRTVIHLVLYLCCWILTVYLIWWSNGTAVLSVVLTIIQIKSILYKL